MYNNYVERLIHEAQFQARGLGIPEGAADSFIECAMKEIPRATLKNGDEALIYRIFVRNLAKYHRDLAYVLKNYQNVL